MEEKNILKEIRDWFFTLALLGIIIWAGALTVAHNDHMKGLKRGRVYDDAGNAYYCRMGEMSKKRLELLEQAKKLRE